MDANYCNYVNIYVFTPKLFKNPSDPTDDLMSLLNVREMQVNFVHSNKTLIKQTDKQ